MAHESITIGIGASLLAGFGAAFKSAESQMGRLGDVWRKTKAELGRIEKLNQLESKLKETETALSEARAEAARLYQAYQSAPEKTKELKAAWAKAEQQAERLNRKLQSQRDRLEKAREAAREHGLELDRLAEQEKKLQAVFNKVDPAHQKLGAAISLHEQRKRHQQALYGQIGGAVASVFSLAAPIRIAVDFEQSIAKLGAITGAEGESLNALEKQARTLGASTVFTASEAASAMTYLGMAGFKTNEILAATPGVLNLAQAAGADLAETADIASNILSGFNLEARETGRVGDVLAKAMTTSNVNLQQLGETMKYVAPAASSVGASLEEVAAMTGLLGNVGIQGSNAGTALRAAFLRLAKPPREAAEALNQLGVSIKTADGRMRAMPEILKDIWAATQDIGDADRIAVLTKLFGTEAASAMAELARQAGAGALDTYVQALKNAKGATAEMAEKMNATTQGALKRLGSAIESLSITLGSVLLPVVADVAEGLSHVATSVAEFADAHPVLTKAVLGTVAALVAFRVGLLAGRLIINSTLLGLSGLNVTLKTVAAAYTLAGVRAQQFALSQGRLGRVLGAVDTGLSALRGRLLGAAGALGRFGRGFLTLARLNPIGMLLGIGTALWALWRNSEAVGAFLRGAFSGLSQGIGDVAGVIGSALRGLASAFGAVLGWFGSLFGASEEASVGVDGLSESVSGTARVITALGVAVGALWKLFRLSPVGLVVTALTLGAGLVIDHWQTVKELFGSIWETVKARWNAFADWVLGFWKKISAPFKAVGSLWNQVRGAFGGTPDAPTQQTPQPASSLWRRVAGWFGGDNEQKPQPAQPAMLKPVKAVALGAAIGTAMPVAAQPQPVTAVAPVQQQAGAQPQRPSIAPVPPPAATQPVVNNHHVDNSTIQISVQQQPGEDAEMLARRVAEELQLQKMRSEWDID